MADKRELQVQEKREVDKAQEQTRPLRAFLPTADIFETEDALTLILEMPGVDRSNIDVNVDNGMLTIEGRIALTSTTACSPFTANTISVRSGAVFAFQTGSIRTRSRPRCAMALSR